MDKLEQVKKEIERRRDIFRASVASIDGCKANVLTDILNFIDSMQEEPVSEDLEEVAKNHAVERYRATRDMVLAEKCKWSFKAGAEWQKTNLWKPADGDDLPEIDREVIALLDNGKVVFAHRPPEFWDGKDIDTGKVTRYYPKTYDKGGWNIPDVKYWLDCQIPKIDED